MQVISRPCPFSVRHKRLPRWAQRLTKALIAPSGPRATMTATSPIVVAARRLRELPYKPAVAQVHFRLAAFAAPFAARVHAAVDIRIRAASIISFPLGALRGGRPNSLLTGNFTKKRTGNSGPN